jgi:hypothetical protein
MNVAVEKFAEARANSAVAGTELKGKIKVITLHYLLCNTSLCSTKPTARNAGRSKGTVFQWDLIIILHLRSYVQFLIYYVVVKAFCYTIHILSRVRRLLPSSSE